MKLLDPREKAAAELRMQHLSQMFGDGPLLNAEVDLPTDALLTSGNEAILEHLCERLGIDRNQVEFRPPDDQGEARWEVQSTASGNRLVIFFPEGKTEEGALIYTILGTFLCEFLIQQVNPGLNSRAYGEFLMVYRGLGVVPANLILKEWQAPSQKGNPDKAGGSRSRMIGYALALFAWVRGELKPTWRHQLRPDAQHILIKSLKYLKKREDSFFHAGSMGFDQQESQLTQILENLQTHSESRQIIALQQISQLKETTHQLIPPLQKLLYRAHPSVLAEAMKAAGTLGESAQDVVPLIEEYLQDSNPELQAAAVLALSRLKHDPGQILPEVIRMLRSRHGLLTDVAVSAFENYGSQAEVAYPDLMVTLNQAIVQCNDPLAERILQVIRNISDQPEVVLREHLEERDEEILTRAMFMLKEIEQGEDTASSEAGESHE